MTLPRKFAAVLLTLLAGAAVIAFTLNAQPQNQSQPQIPQPVPKGQIPQPAQPPPPAINRNLILLDPAHGGPDPGATLANNSPEKAATLAFALRLRAALAAANFTVATTRDADPTDALTTDQRAEIANRTHALACIVLHATTTGSGVHIYTSTLEPPAPPSDFASTYVPIPWEQAQAGFIELSHILAGSLRSTLNNANLSALSSQATVRPLDNLMCPAIAVELAPLAVPGGDATPPTDAAYQQRVIVAITTALQNFRDQTAPQSSSDPTFNEQSAQVRAIAAAEAAGAAATRTQPNSQILPAAPRGAP